MKNFEGTEQIANQPKKSCKIALFLHKICTHKTQKSSKIHSEHGKRKVSKNRTEKQAKRNRKASKEVQKSK